MHDPTRNSDDLPFDFGLTGLDGSFRGDGVLFAADQGGSSGYVPLHRDVESLV
ncbi:hypothetical protein AAIB46_06160 [Streptomyces sp. 35M1]|uniref:hypothetical protein n=1 Tax=Streptomyces sp. 35M1 TaxID=3142978 RepID=UPI003990A224